MGTVFFVSFFNLSLVVLQVCAKFADQIRTVGDLSRDVTIAHFVFSLLLFVVDVL